MPRPVLLPLSGPFRPHPSRRLRPRGPGRLRRARSGRWCRERDAPSAAIWCFSGARPGPTSASCSPARIQCFRTPTAGRLKTPDTWTPSTPWGSSCRRLLRSADTARGTPTPRTRTSSSWRA
ncbi:hypothetical protein FOCC_FOCC014603 [Frankliniella occidentalis]|nr:hypothetical protein FOCC_FOCC014603 [Frankliniella occidentalis]